MTQFEKAIKTIAIVIAIFVVIVIIGGIVTAIVAITSVCSSDKAGKIFKDNARKAVESTVSLVNVDETFDASDVEDLEIISSIGTVTLCHTNTNDIHVSGMNLNDASVIEMRGDKLYVESAAVNVELFGVKLGEKINEEDIGIRIEVPEGFEFDSVYLESGMGCMSVDELTAENLKIENGMGDIDCKNVFAESTKIKNGVGNIKMEFTGGMNDFDMEMNPGIGSITVDGIRQNDIKHTNRDADNSIKIEGGAGTITVSFTE
ncbi:MAG: DUF4097 family beta strand repeat-containing protein [bacterium]|nr:DUF4097 family beta strand repeat-containing protein [bacterium]